jgi:hypothetical protein
MNNLFKIYPLQNYKTLEKTFNKNVVEGTIDEIIEKLQSNKGYNIRVNPDKPCLVYGDFDHCTQEEFNNFLKVISDEFECKLNEISYTESIKPNEYSYHWSIPSIKISTPEKLKTLFKQANYKMFSKNIDFSVYSTHFLRLPNQTNKDKPIEHKIINGKMEDFIIEYISKCPYTFDVEDEDEEQIKETTIQKPKLKDDDIVDEIKNCLLCLDATLYEDWMKVALIINNELGGAGLEILHEWSEQSDNYNYDTVTSFYNNIKPKENGLKIGSLKKMAKEEDSILYKKLFSKNKNKNEVTDLNGVFSDDEAAQKVYELYPFWVCCNDELYVFDDSTGLWTKSQPVFCKIISRFNEYLYILTTNSNEEIKKSKISYGNTVIKKLALLTAMKSLCINNSWLINTHFSSLHKILFTNGYYDMTTGIFNESFNPDIVFFNRINRKYVINDLDNDYINDVKQRLFYNQLGEDVGDYLILNVARSLAGDRMKKIFFGLGETNAGKSTLVNATINTFSEYTGTFNGENLCIKNTSNDEAQIMRWALLLQYKRILFSNEMKSESVLSGNMMKKVSSGGDKLVGRGHGGNETDFYPHFNVFCNANDLLEIKPFDSAINERLNIISYKKKYVDEPSNEFELKKDNNIDVELRSENFINAFQSIIFDSYLTFFKNGKKEFIPEAVKNCKTEWVGEDSGNTTLNKFLESFEITNNLEHYIKSSEIEHFLKENKLNISITKFTMEIKKYCSIKKFSNVEGKVKKLNGKAVRVWFGINSINENDDDNEQDI